MFHNLLLISQAVAEPAGVTEPQQVLSFPELAEELDVWDEIQALRKSKPSLFEKNIVFRQGGVLDKAGCTSTTLCDQKRVYISIMPGQETQSIKVLEDELGMEYGGEFGHLNMYEYAWSDNRSMMSVLEQLSKQEFVFFAEPYYEELDWTLASASSDYNHNDDLWHLEGSFGAAASENQGLGTEAWFLTKGEGALVSIYDTGVITEHDDFWPAPRDWYGYYTQGNGADWVTEFAQSQHYEDANTWHGTVTSLQIPYDGYLGVGLSGFQIDWAGYGDLWETQPWDMYGDANCVQLYQSYSAADYAAFHTNCRGSGHGTAMASIIAGNESTTGAIGVAPEAKIFSNKVIMVRSDGSRTLRVPAQDTLSLIDFNVVDLNSKVHNFSLDRGRGSPWFGPLGLAVTTFLQQYPGSIFVFSAGNSGSLIPASSAELNTLQKRLYQNILIVAATDKAGLPLPSSNYSTKWVDIAAPGQSIFVASNEIDDYAVERMNWSQHRRTTGTSPAAAVVSGTAALVVSVRPELTGAEIKESILRGASTNLRLGQTVRASKQLYAPGAILYAMQNIP